MSFACWTCRYYSFRPDQSFTTSTDGWVENQRTTSTSCAQSSSGTYHCGLEIKIGKFHCDKWSSRALFIFGVVFIFLAICFALVMWFLYSIDFLGIGEVYEW